MKIYLVDDDSEEAELFGEAIERIDSSIELVWHYNVMDALDALIRDDTPPNVLFLDLNIPKISGKQLLKLLRMNKQTKDLPIVIYSTSISKKDIEDTEAYGVKAFLQKPEDFTILVNEVREILGFGEV